MAKKHHKRSSRKKKLRPGVHCVVLKKIGRRKVKVTRSGKWKFMKGRCK